MIKEVVEKAPVTSYLFNSSIQKNWDPSKPCLTNTYLSSCSQSSKTSMANFGQLVASSALWFKASLIVRMQSKYHTFPFFV